MGWKQIVNPAPLIQNFDSNTAPAPNPNRASRPWQVLHTCNSITEISDIVAGELAIGMRPSVVTPEGFALFADALRLPPDDPATQISLLNAWNDVRQWRKVILDADPLSEFDLLHAHSFAAGMAGVRNFPATVYEIDQFIEDAASGVSPKGTTSSAEHSSWLSRSFRVAEQFVLSRAAAVVVRTESVRQAVIHRGASAENVFVVPKVVNEEDPIPTSIDGPWLQSLGIDREQSVLIYAPDWKMEVAADGLLSEPAQGLLSAFVFVVEEQGAATLMLHCPDATKREVREFAQRLKIDARLKLIATEDHQRAFDAAHVIVADSYSSISSTPLANETAFSALRFNKTLLAADLPCNRDVSPTGRGCLWYRSGDYKDIAHRMAFLAVNPDFRAALAESGNRYLLESCNPAAVALKYDSIYRHAAARRKSGGLQTPAIQLTPASAML
jgi:hypothetical protein